MHPSVNVNGTELQPCSTDPMTGWYRDGCCNTDANDRGSHVVCCTLTEDFLLFAKSQGNDLMTPVPQYGFPWPQARRLLVCVRPDLVGCSQCRGGLSGEFGEHTRGEALAIVPIDILEAHSE